VKHLLLALSSLFFTVNVVAQIGGNNIYEFMLLPSSARLTGLGDHLISVKDADINLAYQNPALLNKSMDQQLSFQQNFHLADVKYGYFAYGKYLEKWQTTFHTGIQYINYGEFDASDVFGNINGTFKAAEYALTLGASKQLYDKLSVGTNLKLISSQLETYSSIGWSSDVGVTYQDTSKNLGLGLVFRNIGTPITNYTQNNQATLPFEVQLGLSKRLRYLPFRFSVLYRYLNRWNILYDDPTTRENTSIFDGFDNVESNNPALNNFFRHFVFNGEFLFGKAEVVRLRLGYNVLRAQEMKVNNLRSLAGFSFGFGFKIKRFQIDYGQGVYHLAGSSNHLGISTNLSTFR